MDNMLILDGARAVHLLGLASGLGLALTADALALRFFMRPITRNDLHLLDRLHKLILAGLTLLWISGLTLLYLRTGFDMAQFTPKLMVKLGVVGLLSINALAVGALVLPTLARYQGCRFGDIPALARLRLALIGGLSSACWSGALALGVFSQLKTQTLSTLLVMFALLLCTCFLAATAAAFNARRIARLHKMATQGPQGGAVPMRF
ncbi:MAG: hypothetical protein AB8B51_06500 [Sedimentitalea sp.]